MKRLSRILRPRYTIATLLAMVTLAALVLAPVGQAGREYRAEQNALKQLTGGNADDSQRIEIIHEQAHW